MRRTALFDMGIERPARCDGSIPCIACMKERLRRWIPSPEAVRGNRWLRWLGPALHHPRLWHVSRRGIALGVAIGMFFGLLLPVAQIPFSAALAVALRANVPAAVASTLVTNPVTSVPLYYAAWRLGSAVLGRPAVPPGAGLPQPVPQVPAARDGDAQERGWFARTWERLRGVGKPLMLGLALLACIGGALSYVVVTGIWRVRTLWMRRRRLRQRALRSGAGAG
jgi:uncharacterized protein (DUF2062 family)